MSSPAWGDSKIEQPVAISGMNELPQEIHQDVPQEIDVVAQVASLPAELAKTPEEMRREEERMRDVQVLLQNLTLQEETTIKLIIDCLYDVGSVKILNTKVAWKPANRVVKLLARTSKPVFRAIAWRWFKGNCPELITDWLASKVR